MTLCVMHYASPNRMPAMFITLAVALIMILLTDIAAAQSERDADFQAYCRAKHPNSSHQRTGLTHYCRQPGATIGFVNHNIDLAEACRMTTGNASFRRLGTRIICTAGTGPAPTPQQASPGAMGGQPVGPPDFARYCRTRYTNSTYLKRTRSWGTEHLCRQPGRTIGFVHHNIDMADACRMTRNVPDYRIDGATVTCMRSGAVNPEDQRRPGGGSGPGPKPGPVPPGPIPPGPKPGPVPPGPKPGPKPGLSPDSGKSPSSREETVPVPAPRAPSLSEIRKMICEGQPSSEARQWCYQHWTPIRGAKTPDSARSTDTNTGTTTTSVRNPDGSLTVTKTDKDGNVLSREKVGKSPDSASSIKLNSGETTTSVANPDGTRTVTKTDKDGNVLSREKVR